MSKYYFFLDETGDHGLSFVDRNFPIFLLCGCLFKQEELDKTEKEVNNFKRDFFKTEQVILHSREIRKCEGSFQVLFDLDLKRKFYEKLNDILQKSQFTIIASGVNKEEHIKKYGKGAKDPYALSLSFIIERLIFCLDSYKNSSSVEIKIEKRGRKEDQQLLDQYNFILDKGTYFIQPKRIQSRIEKFDFCSKRDNIIGVQISDLCAYPLARHVIYSSEPYIPFKIIENKIYCDKKHEFSGYGLKMFP